MEKIDTNIFTKDLQSKYTVLQFCSEIYRYLVEVLFPYINKLEDNKQDKEAQDLLTTAKEIVSAINELKSKYTTIKENIDQQRGLIQQNKHAIDKLENTKQDKTDDGLKTSGKTIVGGINELKRNIDTLTSDKQDKNDSSLKTSVKTVVGGINELNTEFDNLETRVESAENSITTLTSDKQDKTDNGLNTSAKTVVGGINELKDNIDTLTSDKQDKTDNGLKTSVKTVVGGINELNTEFDNLETRVESAENSITTLTSDKQDKTDNGLNTSAKTVVGGINELKDNIDTLTSDKQDKTDNGLNTSAKTVVGGINEVNSYTKMLQPKIDNELTTPEKTIVPAINSLYKYQDDLGDLGYYSITLSTTDKTHKIFIALLTFEYVIKTTVNVNNVNDILNSIAIPTSDNVAIVKGLMMIGSDALVDCKIINYNGQAWNLYAQTFYNANISYQPYAVSIDKFTDIDIQFEMHPLSS